MATFAAGSQSSPLAVFRNRGFLRMWTAQLVSSAGSALTALAASILIYRLTGSALSVGLMMMATALPTLFVGLMAGVFVDRYDRKRIMVAADLMRAVLVGAIPFLIPFNILWLYVIVAVSSAVGQFFDPAYASVLPEVASDEELAAANSMMAISTIGAQAVGFAASGLIAARLDLHWAFYLDAASFAFSAACLLGLRLAPLPVEGETNVASLVRNLRAGFRMIVDTPSLRSLFIVYLLIFITFGLNNALLLPFVRRALQGTEFDFGLVQAAEPVGIAIGSLLMARLADRLREGQWIAISFIMMALLGIVFSQVTAVAAAAGLYAVVAVFNSPSVIGRQLLIQRNTPRAARGRVFSAFFVMRDTMFLVGMALAGLADVIAVRELWLGQSLIFLAFGTLALVLPGLGQPAAEWRRAIQLLRGAKVAPRLGAGRAATLADFDLLAERLPALATLSARERQSLAAETLVTEAPPGTIVVYKGEASDAAYFILEGQAVAGLVEGDDYRLLEVLNPGDFFGEIAALTGVPRTANVITESQTTLLHVPAAALRQLSSHPAIHRVFMSRLTERMARMNMMDLPLFNGQDQTVLRELRTPAPDAPPS